MAEEVTRARRWQSRVLLTIVLGSKAGNVPLCGLLSAVRDKKWQVRAAAVQSLCNFKKPDVVDAFIERLGKETGRLREDLRNALVRLTGQTGLREAVDWRNWWKPRRKGFRFPAGNTPPKGSAPIAASTRGRRSKLYDVVLSRKVIFVIDTSGSMRVRAGENFEGLSRLGFVKKELIKVINEQLSEKSRFNIITFGDKAYRWKKSLVPASSSNRHSAKECLRALKPTGATNVIDALALAFKDPAVDTVYFLSDGYPTAGRLLAIDDILGEVRRWNRVRRIRIHAIAFLAGEGGKIHVAENKEASKIFLRALAKENGGRYKSVEK
jgi:hypothetical protein